MKNFLCVLDKALNSIVPLLISTIQGFSVYQMTIFLFLLITSGQLINYFQHFKHFHIYQLLVTTTIILASYSIRKFLHGMEEFKQMTASHPIKFVGIKIAKLIQSKWSIPGIVIIGGLYVYSSIRLEYIRFDLIGLYALIMIILMMITAVFGQTIYVYYIILLNKLSHENEFSYNFYMPAKTDWIIKLAKNGRMLNNSFFVLGFIYTLVYYLNMPSNSILIYQSVHGRIWDRFLFCTPDNQIFVLSWMVIFIIIFIAFPIYYIIQTYHIKMLIRRLKDISISEIQKLMKAQELTGHDSIDLELQYFNLINNIECSPKKLCYSLLLGQKS